MDQQIRKLKIPLHVWTYDENDKNTKQKKNA